MRGLQQLLDETQRSAETLAEHSRLDEQTVANFKAQVFFLRATFLCVLHFFARHNVIDKFDEKPKRMWVV